METPFEVFQIYLALKQHFTKESYDYFLYNGKLKTTPETLDKRPDRYSFVKLSKKRAPGSFILANVVSELPTKPFPYIVNLVNDPHCEQIYTEWEKRRQTLTHVVRSELSALDTDFDSNFKCANGQIPKILKLQLSKKICPELPVVACKLVPTLLPYWNSKMGANPMFDSLVMRTKKYLPFVEIDEERMRSTFLAHFKPEER
jgi:hypothetical protein